MRVAVAAANYLRCAVNARKWARARLAHGDGTLDGTAQVSSHGSNRQSCTIALSCPSRPTRY
jgi:hypothetical protein